MPVWFCDASLRSTSLCVRVAGPDKYRVIDSGYASFRGSDAALFKLIKRLERWDEVWDEVFENDGGRVMGRD